MVYPYYCEHCDVEFDVTKSMHDSSRFEKCFTCGKEARRVYSSNVEILGASVEHAEYNPAFGQVVKNKYHRGELAKRRGMIEIGSEPVEKLHSNYDRERAEKFRKRLDED